MNAMIDVAGMGIGSIVGVFFGILWFRGLESVIWKFYLCNKHAVTVVNIRVLVVRCRSLDWDSIVACP